MDGQVFVHLRAVIVEGVPCAVQRHICIRYKPLFITIGEHLVKRAVQHFFYRHPFDRCSKNPDGSLQLDGICLVAGLGGKDHRDGSLAYYFSEPVVCNDAKGVGPLVLAYTEMIARK